MVALGGACVVALGGAWLLPGGWGACMVFSGGHAWFFRGRACFFLGGVWFFTGGVRGFFRGGMRRIRRDTVNERAVRILLECILFGFVFVLRENN